MHITGAAAALAASGSSPRRNINDQSSLSSSAVIAAAAGVAAVAAIMLPLPSTSPLISMHRADVDCRATETQASHTAVLERTVRREVRRCEASASWSSGPDVICMRECALRCRTVYGVVCTLSRPLPSPSAHIHRTARVAKSSRRRLARKVVTDTQHFLWHDVPSPYGRRRDATLYFNAYNVTYRYRLYTL